MANGCCDAWQLLCNRKASDLTLPEEHDRLHQRGNGEVTFVLDQPTDKESSFEFPAVGETGDNLCRLLRMLKSKGVMMNVCRFNVGIVDVRDNNGKRDVISVLKEIGSPDYLIACGDQARRFVRTVRKCLFDSMVMCVPHLSVRGLMSVAVVEGEYAKCWRSTVREAVNVIAEYLVDCIKSGNKGFRDITEFNEFCRDWRPRLWSDCTTYHSKGGVR